MAVLELAGPVFGPALNCHFLIRVELDRVVSLRVHDAEKAVLLLALDGVGATH